MLPSWLLACSGPDKTPDHSGDAPGAWQVVAEGLPAALLTVTGGGADDVWAAGAAAGPVGWRLRRRARGGGRTAAAHRPGVG